MKDEYQITNMSFQELEQVVTWAEAEGWNPGLHDAQCYYQVDPHGFFIGRLNEKPIAAGSAVIYDDKFAFCGYYLVLEDYRKKGFGMTLTKRRLEYIGDRNAGIDGVIEMVDKYKNLGYEVAHHNIRYTGQGPIQISQKFPVTPLSVIKAKDIFAYDRLHFPADRQNFLKCWFSQTHGLGYGVVIDKKLCGYGFIRPSVEGFRIGPLFADNQDIADVLFTNLVQHAGSSKFFMDCPVEANLDGQALAKHYNLQETFKSARMYLKYEPDILIKNVYGITSLELG